MKSAGRLGLLADDLEFQSIEREDYKKSSASRRSVTKAYKLLDTLNEFS